MMMMMMMMMMLSNHQWYMSFFWRIYAGQTGKHIKKKNHMKSYVFQSVLRMALRTCSTWPIQHQTTHTAAWYGLRHGMHAKLRSKFTDCGQIHSPGSLFHLFFRSIKADDLWVKRSSNKNPTAMQNYR